MYVLRDMFLRSSDRFPDVLVLDHDTKFTSEVFRAFVKSIGSILIVGSAYHSNTNPKVERADGVIGDTLHAYANGSKDDWDDHPTLAVFGINNVASTLGCDLTPFFIDSSTHPRLPLSPPRDDRAIVEQAEHYQQRMRAIETAVRELLAAAATQAERTRSSTRACSTLCSRWATACCCGPRSCSTRQILVSYARGGTDPSQ